MKTFIKSLTFWIIWLLAYYMCQMGMMILGDSNILFFSWLKLIGFLMILPVCIPACLFFEDKVDNWFK